MMIYLSLSECQVTKNLFYIILLVGSKKRLHTKNLLPGCLKVHFQLEFKFSWTVTKITELEYVVNSYLMYFIKSIANYPTILQLLTMHTFLYKFRRKSFQFCNIFKFSLNVFWSYPCDYSNRLDMKRD